MLRQLAAQCAHRLGAGPARVRGAHVGALHKTPLNPKKQKGVDILHDPLWNKGSAFTEAERDRLGLRGLLPPVVQTIEDQSERFLERMRSEGDDPMAKNLMLQGLHNRNETLFHRVLVDSVEEIAPLVYTPTVGLVCQTYSHTFTRPRGMVLTPADRGNMSVIMRNWPASQCQVVVVTDGSRILGLGDLGANGMGIPIGKLALYCAYGGIAPHRVLPVMLDLGTDNQKLLEDPEYRGWRHPRLEGKEYTSMVDEFMQAVYRRFPSTLVQFEDFSSDKASAILDRYRDQYLCFNDDIQGTGATVLAGVLGALRMRGQVCVKQLIRGLSSSQHPLGDPPAAHAGSGARGHPEPQDRGGWRGLGRHRRGSIASHRHDAGGRALRGGRLAELLRIRQGRARRAGAHRSHRRADELCAHRLARRHVHRGGGRARGARARARPLGPQGYNPRVGCPRDGRQTRAPHCDAALQPDLGL